MATLLSFPLPMDVLTAFCQRHRIVCLEAFGSIIRDDFGPESDIDLMYTLAPGAIEGMSLFDLVDWEEELSELLGRKVDLVDRVGVEQSRNPFARKRFLESALPLLDLGLPAEI